MFRPNPAVNQSALLLICFLAIVFGFVIETTELEAQSEAYPSFRVLSPEKSPEETSAPNPVVWLAGKIEQMGGGWTQQLGQSSSSKSLDIFPVAQQQGVSENITLDHDQLSTHSTFDTTQLASYQDDSSVVGRALSDADEKLDSHSQSPAKALSEKCLDCEPARWISWKSTTISGAWLPGSGDQLGTTIFNLSGKIVSPRLKLVTLTPSYQMYLLKGPEQTDVPSTLHYASVSLTGYIPFSDRWIGQVSVAPGVASDFQTGNSKQFRITGVGMMIFKQSEQLQWTFGVAYLDREDISLLPLAGISWSPDERTSFEFVFPRPRIKRQLSKSGEYEKWGYLGAEFGGGSWAINRANGVDDMVVLREYRLLGGVEYKLPENRNWFWETGLVMGRSVEYASGVGDYEPGTAFIIGGGLTY